MGVAVISFAKLCRCFAWILLENFNSVLNFKAIYTLLLAFSSAEITVFCWLHARLDSLFTENEGDISSSRCQG
jgi:hypothetical protein